MKEFIDKVREAGVVGAGGAGFPTHVKLSAKVDTVVANGAECEPLLDTDKNMILCCPDKVVRGMVIAMECTGAKQGYIGIKKKAKAQCEALTRSIKKFQKEAEAEGKSKGKGKEKLIEVKYLENVYPSGDEHLLVTDVTGRVIPEVGLPLDVGVVVSNTTTLINMADAVDEGKAVTHKIITITGEVEAPKTIFLPVGTSYIDAVKCAGGVVKGTLDDYVLIDGGPLMGRFITDWKGQVTKTTSAIIVLHNRHPHVQRGTSGIERELRIGKEACCQCRMCTDLCRFLQGHRIEPHMTMRTINYDQDNMAQHIISAQLCCQCGVCELYACPLLLSPRKIYASILEKLAAKKFKYPKNDIKPELFPQREMRIPPTWRMVQRCGLTKYDKPHDHDGTIPEIKKVAIPMSQHIGAPCEPVVKQGDKVHVGQMIGKIPEKSLGAPVHASISGTVTGVSRTCIEIEA